MLFQSNTGSRFIIEILLAELCKYGLGLLISVKNSENAWYLSAGFGASAFIKA